jgi:hypothetical protein
MDQEALASQKAIVNIGEIVAYGRSTTGSGKR